jgi:ATP-dependent Lhr-like helicase
VLRLLRRRSLAALRREVEPVDPVTLARFLPAWQGVATSPSLGGPTSPSVRGPAALERLAEVVDQLAGLPVPASVLERDVLPARVPGYQPRLLDELGALGEVAWVGRGSLGRDEGRVVLHRPGRELPVAGGLIAGVDGAASRPESPLHDAIRDHLTTRGASFFRAIQGAVTRLAPTEREVLDALWDLAWAGEVTNDTFAPLRALRWKRPARASTPRGPRLGRLTALGPPEAAGRWSIVGSGVWDPAGAPASPTERAHQLALALLDRHGVLVREAVMAEGLEGGFAAIYPMLRALEEAGRIRRGYFVAGLGAAQFALAGALDRLRAVREPGSSRGDAQEVHFLAAADPANPYGAALAWPRRGDSDKRPFQRAAGAYVVLVDGVAALYLDRGGTSLQTLPAFDDTTVAEASLGALHALLADGSRRELVIARVDGEPAGRSRVYESLMRAGFIQGYRGLVLRKSRVPAMIA